MSETPETLPEYVKLWREGRIDAAYLAQENALVLTQINLATAIMLLEACEDCDLIYDAQYRVDGVFDDCKSTVSDHVRAFLKAQAALSKSGAA